MKKYTLIATTIALFLGTQIVAMDRKPSAGSITDFKNFLAYKLSNPPVVEDVFITPLNNVLIQFPMVDWNLLIEYKLHILDTLTKHHIDRAIGKGLFIDMLENTIKQAIASENPHLNEGMIQRVYQTYVQNILRIASTIFDR